MTAGVRVEMRTSPPTTTTWFFQTATGAPMAGTGPEESQRIVDLIAGLKNRVAILLVEHDMDAVFRLADRISVMVNGAVIACGEPQAIRSDPMVIAAYLGEEHSA